MVLYHISFDIDNIIKSFVPRVPIDKAKTEDSITPRICLAPTIEQALMAKSDSIAHKAICKNDGKYITDIPFVVYEIDVSGKRCIWPNEIYLKHSVADVAWTEEVWLIERVAPSKTYCGILHSYDISSTQPLTPENNKIFREMWKDKYFLQYPTMVEAMLKMEEYKFVWESPTLISEFIKENEICWDVEEDFQDMLEDIAGGASFLLENIKYSLIN